MENEKRQESITIEDLASVPGGETLNAEQMQGVEGGGLASSPLGISSFPKFESTATTLSPGTLNAGKFDSAFKF